MSLQLKGFNHPFDILALFSSGRGLCLTDEIPSWTSMTAAQRRQYVGADPSLAAIDRLLDEHHAIWGKYRPGKLAKLVA
jgi:hypothetical protein